MAVNSPAVSGYVLTTSLTRIAYAMVQIPHLAGHGHLGPAGSGLLQRCVGTSTSMWTTAVRRSAGLSVGRRQMAAATTGHKDHHADGQQDNDGRDDSS